jgi:hypothetical protein
LVHFKVRIALEMLRIIGAAVGDVILTREEIDGLMANLLISSQPPTGWTRFSEWLNQNASELGKKYSSELQRHYR